MTTSIQSLGGKARAANMTPEERTAAARHAATKGARKLGKEGRRLRALKGAATRKARAEAAQKWGSTLALEAEIDAAGKPGQPTCFCKGTLESVDGFEVNHSPKSCGWIREGEPGTKAFFEAGRKAGHRLADNFVNAGLLPKPPTYGAAIPPGDARRLQFNLAPSARNAHLEASHRECAEAIVIARPKRQEPKLGTLNDRVLGGMREIAARFGPGAVALTSITMMCGVDGRQLANALSSLRSAGHVVSEPKPGSRREKLWRLA